MSPRLAPWPRLTGREPCQNPDNDPELWSGGDGDHEIASLLCQPCPAREDCLAWAVDHPGPAGDATWAGTTRRQRQQLRREFGIPTAPKEDPTP
ncbi:WhiB family transcriptional regulator [Streptomyces aurantiacus]|uniref:4Fe-4S Wbl-type domain-containing protein n=1 Tax=Streptomyces aurantiacus JA 4570 TaxID=1286094 RepID=S3ZTW5_9ACTN|nr:WhiB family transcriptional regulator [Streptomyces aurantiacus]EPH46886.1 hypothetical protein STRAU_0052 [Streptomyces aurantiacus JA 4570]